MKRRSQLTGWIASRQSDGEAGFKGVSRPQRAGWLRHGDPLGVEASHIEAHIRRHPAVVAHGHHDLGGHPGDDLDRLDPHSERGPGLAVAPIIHLEAAAARGPATITAVVAFMAEPARAHTAP